MVWDSGFIVLWALAAVRMISFIAVSPVFSLRAVPSVAKIGLGGMMGLLVLPGIEEGTLADIGTGIFFLFAAKEALCGLALGFVTLLVYSAVRVAGGIIDIQTGLTMAALMDPQTQSRTALMEQMVNIISMLVFLALDGHHLLLAAVYRSFSYVPLGQMSFDAGFTAEIFHIFIGMFSIGVQIAAPFIAVLAAVDISLAILSRAVPQLNVFMMGFPIKIATGNVLMLLVLPILLSGVGFIISEIEKEVVIVLEIMKV